MDERGRETIVRAAVRIESGAVFTGRRHSECIKSAVDAGVSKPIRQDQQGFLTSCGRFVDRPIAGKIACAAGQIAVEKRYLLSEDLWWEGSK